MKMLKSLRLGKCRLSKEAKLAGYKHPLWDYVKAPCGCRIFSIYNISLTILGDYCLNEENI